MRKRILVAEPDPDVRAMLEATLTRLGHEAVGCDDADTADAVVLEPGCPVARSLLRRFGRAVPPVVCLSIWPHESVELPPETVAYLQKPSSSARLAAVLAGVFAA